MSYTNAQQSLLRHAETRIVELFKKYPVPSHNADHAKRTARYARMLATAEKAKSPFLCELAGLLHDIGRVTEKYSKGKKRQHHELSYELLQKWFQSDRMFTILSKAEKLEILYAVRYHWNSMAMKYDTAFILRDADRLDLMGMRGIHRTREYNPNGMDQFLRNIHDILFWIHTETARTYIQKKEIA